MVGRVVMVSSMAIIASIVSYFSVLIGIFVVRLLFVDVSR